MMGTSVLRRGSITKYDRFIIFDTLALDIDGGEKYHMIRD